MFRRLINAVFLIALFSSVLPSTIADDLDCSKPENAYTLRCGGSGAPASVGVPAPGLTPPPPPAPVPAANVEPVLPAGDTSLPMTTADGQINCANPMNAITTTCWKEGAASPTNTSAAVDCAKPEFKEYPVCTGVKPDVVVVEETAAKNRVPVPVGYNCADPVEALKPECKTGTTTPDKKCEDPLNAGLLECQPMTTPDGQINCANPMNAITTTCWAIGASSATNTKSPVDCANAMFKDFPVCSGIKPEVVLVEEALQKAKAEAEAKIEESAKEVVVAPVITAPVFSAKSKTFSIALDTASENETLIVKAVKKGSKTITFKVSTDDSGDGTIKTKASLKGYTLIVYSGATELTRKKL